MAGWLGLGLAAMLPLEARSTDLILSGCGVGQEPASLSFRVSVSCYSPIPGSVYRGISPMVVPPTAVEYFCLPAAASSENFLLLRQTLFQDLTWVVREVNTP